MRNIRLPSGEWVTTAVASRSCASQYQCPGDTCQWVDFGPPTPPGLFPVPIQLQECIVCRYVRGRYLGSLGQDTEPAPSPRLKIGDQEFSAQQLYVIAVRLEDYPPALGKPVSLIPCCYCQAIVHVDSKSLRLIEQGARVVCLQCAESFCPEVNAGRDPDTGYKISLRELLRHPNWIGGYHNNDIEGMGTIPD